MKIKHLKVAAIMLAGTLLTSSCVGSFQLFNHLAQWNKRATGSKFLNELIFLIISPVYGICSLADVLVLNTIEFWSGSNPMASNIGKTQQVMGQDGRYYAVTTLKNGYKIKTPDGEIMQFIHDQKTDSWSQIENGKDTKLFRFNQDGTIHTYLPNGGTMDVNQDATGLYQVRMAVNAGTYFAWNK